MTTYVVVPPQPVVTPADIPGSHTSNDATIAAYIAAAMEGIDGPSGWVGRAFGVQTLEHLLSDFPCGLIELPCPPVISLTSISYRDAAGVERAVDVSGVTLDKLSGTLRLNSGYWPAALGQAGAIRIRYVAGYNGTSIADGGTGTLPVSVKQAIRFMVQNMAATATQQQMLKVDEVEGVGRREFFTSQADSKTLLRSAESHLAGLRVFR
jgi:uncharacterized phiE125 gp8 family phage protein